MEDNSMRSTKLLTAAAVFTVGLTSAAMAQSGTVPGAVGGAAAGAVVGGPVGAAVGGVAGATLGAIASPPPEVRTYVMQEDVPSVSYQEEVTVGTVLPETVVVHPVPKYESYSYAVVNDHRVIVDRNSRKVVQVVE
jgi:hypothetical protein